MAGGDIQEGQTATNPKTGEQVIFHNGAWHNVPTDPAKQAGIVQGILDARLPIPTAGKALASPYWQGIISEVSKRDPTFSASDYPTRLATRKDFTSGKSRLNITSFNTLLHHIGTLQKAADDLDNYGGLATPLNGVANAALEAGGSARPTNFRQAKLAVTSEAVRAFRGASGSRSDVEEAAAAIPENGSPEQIRGSLSTLASLLAGRIHALGEQYSAGMGKASDGIDLLDADAQRTLKVLGIQSQTKGGDQLSGAAGAVAVGSSAPPSGPATPGATPPDGEVRFNDELPDTSANSYRFTTEQQAALQALAQTGASAEAMQALATQFGGALSADNAQKLAAFYADPKNRGIKAGFDYSKVDEVKPVDAGDGALGAGARGAGNVLTFGLLDEAGALADTVTKGGTYSDNLNTRRGQELFDEQNHGFARGVGQVVGGVPLGGVEFLGAREAARAAGIAAVRSGVAPAEARVIASRVFATRSAGEAAGFGGAYGFGNTDGSATDRLQGAAVNAAASAALGGAAAYGGSRFARAMAARRGATVAARPAALDQARQVEAEALRTGAPVTDAGRMAAMAERQGIAVLPQDIAEGPMVGRMTAGQAQTPFGTNTIRQATDRLYTSFRNRVGEIGGDAQSAADVGGALKQRATEMAAREGARAENTSGAVLDAAGRADDLTGAGQVAQRGATRWMERTAERASQLYADVPIANETDAVIGTTRSALAEINQGMRSNPELGAIFSNPRLQALERALSDEVDPATGEVLREARLNWRDLQEFRTRIGDALDDPRLSEKIASRQLRRLYAALSDDMRATAEAAGPDALRSWRRANNYYDGRMKRVNNTLSAVLGERRDRTANEAMSSLQAMLRSGGTDDAARFSRVLRSMSPDDARTVRATIVSEARGGRQFDPKELASNWSSLSERGKSALLPQRGLRDLMDDAAERAAMSQHDPLAKRSAEQVVADLEAMVRNTGDSAGFRQRMAALSPEEANSVRSLLIHRMGQTKVDAVRAGDGGEVFSISHFLGSWEKMTPQAKAALFGDAEMRSNMNDLATLAKRVQGSEALRGHSNTGAINSLNATTGGLGAAVAALLTGHPIVAAGFAAPAVYQRLSAEALTSKRLLNWLARAPKKPNPAAQRTHIARLSAIARAEPAIAADILSLQQRLTDAFGSAPARLAADERRDHGAPVDGNQGQQSAANQGLQP